MGELLQKELEKAKDGRKYWLWLMETYKLSAGKYVILIPESCTQDAYLSLLFLEDFTKQKNINSVVILSTDTVIKDVAFLFSDKIEEVIIINDKIKESLIKFYCLYEFSSRFIIASLTQPKGRKGKGLLKTGKVCLAEIFAVIIYGLEEVKKKEIPEIPFTSEQKLKIWIEQNNKDIWQLKL
ncbi:MAG: hypothetical protein K1W24_01045 [Lachnospiraceae bacterium]